MTDGLRVGDRRVWAGIGLGEIVAVSPDPTADRTWVYVRFDALDRTARIPVEKAASVLRVPMDEPAARSAWAALVRPDPPAPVHRLTEIQAALDEGSVADQIENLRSLYARCPRSATEQRMLALHEDVLFTELAAALGTPFEQLRAQARTQLRIIDADPL